MQDKMSKTLLFPRYPTPRVQGALDGDGGGILIGLVCAGLGLWRFSVVFLLFRGVFLR